jgi:hypothetical protein
MMKPCLRGQRRRSGRTLARRQHPCSAEYIPTRTRLLANDYGFVEIESTEIDRPPGHGFGLVKNPGVTS